LVHLGAAVSVASPCAVTSTCGNIPQIHYRTGTQTGNMPIH
jgi:hypothetical protein